MPSLSASEEIGLWGELWTILNSPCPERMLDGWADPPMSMWDFKSSSVGLECKTSTDRLRHYVSQGQVLSIDTQQSGFVISLWIGNDPGGITLPELVDQVTQICIKSILLERHLLARGYQRRSSSVYTTRWLLLEEPWIFDSSDIPRVREADPGVQELRYKVQLTERSSLSAAQIQKLYSGLCE
jgi:hypothetical protein